MKREDMKMTIRPVTEKNWREIIALDVASSQKDFIEPNSHSLLEAYFDHHFAWQPFGLYTDERLVGFAMIGAYQQKEQFIWLDRFMIDQHAQNNGYGTLFIQELLTFISKNWVVKTVVLSIHPNNERAALFYTQIGFVDTNEFDPENGERLFIYTYSDRKENTSHS